MISPIPTRRVPSVEIRASIEKWRLAPQSGIPIALFASNVDRLMKTGHPKWRASESDALLEEQYDPRRDQRHLGEWLVGRLHPS